MDGFNGILDIGKEEEVNMMKDRLIGGKIVNRFVGILKNKDSKKIRKILLHCRNKIK